jgi:DegV family protein with EDD domain
MIGIVTDSTANIPKEILARYSIKVLSTYIIFEEEKFKEGELSHNEFCKKLTSSSKRVVTAPATAGEFVDVYSKLGEENDVIFSIHISSKMSNYYRNAQIASEMIKNKISDKKIEIITIDSQSVDLGLGMIVIEAAKLSKEGKSKEEIKNRIENIIKNIKGYFYVDTLEYLVKSTRVSRVKGLLGSFLNMKPILGISNGEVILKDKAIGKENCLEKILKIMENEIKPNSKIKLGIVNSLLEKDAEILLNTIKTKFNCVEIFRNNTSQSVVINTGPNNLGIFFYEV